MASDFRTFRNRFSLVDFEKKKFCLFVSDSRFYVYGLDGSLWARSCSAMFSGEVVKKFNVSVMRGEQRFLLRSHDESLVFLYDLEDDGGLVDVLVRSDAGFDSFNFALFLLVCQKLILNGFSVKGEGDFVFKTFVELRTILIAGDVTLTFVNGCIVYDWMKRRDLVTKVARMFDEMDLDQFCVLKI